MRITIEKVDNGFLVVYETDRGRKVTIYTSAEAALAYVNAIVSPSPIVVPTEKPLALV